MDLLNIISASVATGVISIGVAQWLAQRMVQHALDKDMKQLQSRLDLSLANHKAILDGQLAATKVQLEAEYRDKVETKLGDQAVKRQYEFEAKRRLYSAIGPLRFQLLLASIDYVNRIRRLGNVTSAYDTTLSHYFGKSTAYRLLRIFAIFELIERQTAYADFAVDDFFALLLRFKQQAFRCIASQRTSLEHPAEVWHTQEQHIFRDNLSSLACSLIVTEDSGLQRVMRFDEFTRYLSDSEFLQSLQPIPHLLSGFSPIAKPVLWLRLVCLANLCGKFATEQSESFGIESHKIEAEMLLKLSGDSTILQNIGRYLAVLVELSSAIVERKNYRLSDVGE